MNRTRLMAITIVTTILMAGCNKDNSQPLQPEDNQTTLNITGGIHALTRAHDAVWDTGDAIGIFMFATGTTIISEEAENRKYVTADGNGKFSPANTTPNDQTIYLPLTGNTDFMAYYPWQKITSNGESYFYAVDVSGQTTQKNIDLMAAGKVTGRNKDHADVAFEFTHKLVKIMLTDITNSDGLTATDLQGLTVKLTNQYTRGAYDVVQGGEVTVNTTEAKGEIPLLVATNSTSAEAIVLPAASTAGMELVFTLANGEAFRWAVNKATNSQEFISGKKYCYKIIISRSGLHVTSTINDWIAGNGNDGEGGTAE